jgi:hypothetical protein
MKNLNDHTGNRKSELPACGAVTYWQEYEVNIPQTCNDEWNTEHLSRNGILRPCNSWQHILGFNFLSIWNKTEHLPLEASFTSVL